MGLTIIKGRRTKTPAKYVKTWLMKRHLQNYLLMDENTFSHILLITFYSLLHFYTATLPLASCVEGALCRRRVCIVNFVFVLLYGNSCPPEHFLGKWQHIVPRKRKRIRVIHLKNIWCWKPFIQYSLELYNKLLTVDSIIRSVDSLGIKFWTDERMK